MPRLPNTGSDAGSWGSVLNEFLRVAHHEDGTLKGVLNITNVQDFGAVGDGQTDDTYNVTSSLVIEDKPIILAGAGLQATVIKYSGIGDAIRFKRVTGVEGAGAGVRDLVIEGMGDASAGTALHLYASYLLTVERVWIRYFSASGGVGLRISHESQDLYLAHVQVQGCDIGFVLESAFQVMAVNLMVNQNVTGGAKIITVGAFRWIGGLVQGGAEQFGVRFEPPAPGVITAVTLDGLYFEGDFSSHVQSLSPPSTTGGKVGITNLLIQNNRFTASKRAVKFLDLSGVIGLMILNNRFYWSLNDTLLRLRDCFGVVVGLSDINWSGREHPQLLDVSGVDILWMNGAQIGLGTPLPPLDEKLAVGGQSRFATVGLGTIPAGESTYKVSNLYATKDSHVMVTLKMDPGASCSILWVTSENGAFTISLNSAVEQNTAFSYFIIEPIG